MDTGFPKGNATSIESRALSRHAIGLRDKLAAGGVTAIDLDPSRRYALGHIPGAWFAIRSRLGATLSRFADQTIVLTSGDGALALLAAAELRAATSQPVTTLAGGTQAWFEAGLPFETGTTRMADQADEAEPRCPKGSAGGVGLAGDSPLCALAHGRVSMRPQR